MDGSVLPFDMSEKQSSVFAAMAPEGRLVGELVSVALLPGKPNRKAVFAVVRARDGRMLEGTVPLAPDVALGDPVIVQAMKEEPGHVLVARSEWTPEKHPSRAGRTAAKGMITRVANKRPVKKRTPGGAVRELAVVFERSLKAAGIAAEAVEPRVSPQMARGVQATENAWRDIAAEHGMLTSRQVAQLLGSRAKNPSDFTADWRAKGKIIGVSRRNAILYPGYQFRNDEVLPAIPRLIEVAKEFEVPLPELAQWICIPTRQLGGDRPVDHLDEVERVVDAAHGHFGVQW